MVNNPIVSIIILNWNRKIDTAECLESVFNMHFNDFSVILVDNNSSDNSVAFLQSKYPQVHYIRNTENLGFARGTNIGILHALHASPKFIMLLNNDTTVSPHLLTELLKVMSLDTQIGLVGAVNYYHRQREKIQFSGGHIDWLRGNIVDFTRHHIDAGQFAKYRQVDTIAGSCMLIRREVFEHIGLLDERFFLNFEETDFCCRARKVGYVIFVSMSAAVWHKVSSSFENRDFLIDYFITRNKFLFLLKHSSGLQLYLSLFCHIAYSIIKVIHCITRNKRRNVQAIIYGVRDFLMRKYYAGSMSSLLK